jgi:hypothetical protein
MNAWDASERSLTGMIVTHTGKVACLWGLILVWRTFPRCPVGLETIFKYEWFPYDTDMDTEATKRFLAAQQMSSNQAQPEQPEAVCLGCGCTDSVSCVEMSCRWLMVDYVESVGVCSNCPGKLQELKEMYDKTP